MRMMICALAGALACAQTAPPLAFDVASIKPSPPDARGGMIRPRPGGQSYVAANVPLWLMIKLMYKVTDSQISGGPEWMNSDRFDIEARAERPSNIDELHEMFKTLLADRFALKFHTETRELPMLALTVDKSGQKMKLSESQQPFEIPIKPAGRGKVAGERVPMSHLAWFLAQQLNRPVVDQTGLDAFYDFELEWAPEPPPGLAIPQNELRDRPEGPDLFSAVRQQLGLKLESQKGPVQVMVIDHVEKPSAN